MATREELTARETETWRTFRAAVDAIAPERRESPILTDGWSVKDMLWHVVFWWDDLALEYESIRSGASRGDGDTDETNARVLEEGRAMSLAEVEAAVERSRARVLATWNDAPDDPRAAEWFLGETVEHYEEHLPSLRAAAG